MPIDSRSFRKALGQFATGVTVVTTRDAAGRPQGLTVNSFCSVSLEPPLVLVCVDQRSEVNPGLHASRLFGVSVLAEDQEGASRRFAEAGEKKFADLPLLTGASGVPLLPGALAHLECRLASAHPGGDHTIFVGEVLSLAVSPGRPLLYHGSEYRHLDRGA
jgi:3-hydroxy-9,10-secoandrosta-1,3,5(10)-triene-9,17-dione monooxygenase reductase component